MLRERLLRIVGTISYYNSLLVGLLPAPLDRRQQEFRSTRIYLTYSAFVHLFSVIATTVGCVYFFNLGFMTTHLVLQWTYGLTYLAKILFIIVLVKEIWCKRRCVMKAYTDYCLLEARHKALLKKNQYVMPDGNPTRNGAVSEHGKIQSIIRDCEAAKKSETRKTSLECRIADLIICKYLLGYGIVVMNAYNFVHRQSSSDSVYLTITFIAVAMNIFMLSALGHFFYVLCQLYRQFSEINQQLQILNEQLYLHKMRIEDNAEMIACRINSLTSLHVDGYRLAQRIFTIAEQILTALLLRLFAANMRTVYNVCLFVNQNMTQNLWSLTKELLFTIVFFCDTGMMMFVLDAALRECNDTGQVLKEFSELVEIHEIDCVRRALDTFSAHLRAHKLRYMVCGLFEFNREASLQFFLMVLVKVTVLVQFDMQNKLRAGKTYII
ncbi:putative gustatory receptor 58a [Rhagoletis pomonella]|uniref:putative gustatory receptor 58a n=1 Tax=Rhagoletis pomonella TaxID=28610 RepID=UPI00178628D2|nr:putative gustatory receptor 58a [Rhagoletis pomonella]